MLCTNSVRIKITMKKRFNFKSFEEVQKNNRFQLSYNVLFRGLLVNQCVAKGGAGRFLKPFLKISYAFPPLNSQRT